MAIARIYTALSKVLIRKLGDAGGPRADQVDEELDNFVSDVNSEIADINADIAAVAAALAAALVPWSYTWFVANPSTASTGAEEYPSFIVPSLSSSFKVTQLRLEYRAGSHAAGNFARFKVVQRGSVDQDVGTIEVNDTNNSAFTLYTSNVADLTLAAGDRLVFTLDARSGTVNERNVSVFAEGVRNLS